ncbi:MAG TPA: enoyl-CoA hydratase/isomerase family protein [Acidimicrobiales bacterium]
MTPRLQITRLPDRTVVILDRLEARNAIDSLMVAELHSVFDELENDPKVLILRGANGVFAAGSDIRELRERGAKEALQGINSRLLDRVARLPMPTIAAIDGPALGAGAELAYACDFRLSTATSKFGNPEPQLGILAAAGACWRLRDLVGEPMAKEVLLAGRILSGTEAANVGLVNSLHRPEELMDAAHQLADRIVRFDPLALRLTKLALLAPPGAHPSFDNVAQAVLFESSEKYRRMDEFLARKATS